MADYHNNRNKHTNDANSSVSLQQRLSSSGHNSSGVTEARTSPAVPAHCNMRTSTRVSRVLALLIILYAASSPTALAAPSILSAECSSQLQCAPDHCCSISGFRFSVPECRPRGRKGDWCRPQPEPHFRTSLTYPGGFELLVEEVFHVLCPCAEDFYCNPDTATCTQYGNFLL